MVKLVSKLRGSIKNSKGMIIMLFSLPGCPRCSLLISILKSYQKDNPDQFELHEIMSLSSGKTHPLAKEYKIKSAPTMLIFKDGVVMDTFVSPIFEDIRTSVKMWGDKNGGNNESVPSKDDSK
jgi:thioredoxin-like negative regulator of GroEL